MIAEQRETGGAASLPAGIDGLGRRPVIGVFGHYGNRNLGDEAIITAVVERLREQQPAVEINCFSLDPEDTAARYGVPAFHIRRIAAAGTAEEPNDESVRQSPASQSDAKEATAAGTGRETKRGMRAALARIPGLRPLAGVTSRVLEVLARTPSEIRFLRYIYRRTRQLDLLIIAGSNQFLDNFGGVWGFPWTLLRWSAIARLAGAKVAFVSVGAGPIDAKLSRVLVRIAIRNSSYTSFRDRASRKLILGESRSNRAGVFPDLAHGLTALPARSTPEWRPDAGGRPVVGINPMPMFDSRYWCVTDASRYQTFVQILASFASGLLRDGYPIFFFSTQPKDENVVDDIVTRLEADVSGLFARETMVKRSRAVRELMSTLLSADIVVATRFHGTLLALLAERPVISIAYYRKSADLMGEMGQDEFVLPLENLQAADIREKVSRLEPRVVGVRDVLSRRNAEYRHALAEQYNQLLHMIGPTGIRKKSTTKRLSSESIRPVLELDVSRQGLTNV